MTTSLSRQIRLLAVLSAIGHASLALGLWQALGTHTESPAWQLLDLLVPEWVWPGVFSVVSLLAGLSVFCGPKCIRLSFYLAGGVMITWGIASLASTWRLAAPFSVAMTGAWLLYVGVLKWMVPGLMLRLEPVEELEQELATIKTERADAGT